MNRQQEAEELRSYLQLMYTGRDRHTIYENWLTPGLIKFFKWVFQVSPWPFMVIFRKHFGREFVTPRNGFGAALLIVAAVAVRLIWGFFYDVYLQQTIPEPQRFYMPGWGGGLSGILFLVLALVTIVLTLWHFVEAKRHARKPPPTRNLFCAGASRLEKRFKRHSSHQVQVYIEPGILMVTGAVLSLVAFQFGLYLMTAAVVYFLSERKTYSQIEANHLKRLNALQVQLHDDQTIRGDMESLMRQHQEPGR